MTVDRFDNVYVTDRRGSRIFKIDQQGRIDTLIGDDGQGSGPTQLHWPSDVAVDRRGNVFVADTGNHRIQRVAPDGSVTTLATGVLFAPSGLAVDHLGGLYIAERDEHRVIRFSSDGRISVVAGGSGRGTGPNELNRPIGLALDGAGTLYIADSGNSRIQAVDLASGVATTVPVTGDWLAAPTHVAVDAIGNLYIDSDYQWSVQRIAPDSTITTLNSTDSYLAGPGGIAIDSRGSLYFADQHDSTEVRRLVNTTPPGPRQITGPFARTTGIEGSIARLYLAILGRQPDLTGYDYWVDQAPNGATINQIAHHFLAATEYTRTRNSHTNTDFINQLYLDVMGRPPDPTGATYWTNTLNNGLDRATVLLLFSESAELKRHTHTN